MIRAAWERGVAGDPQTTAAQALDDAGLLMSPEIAAGLVSEPAVPQTERSYFVAIADALNAVPDHMPLGIDLDGTITDHNVWSVVWNRAAERWEVAGYDVEDVEVAPSNRQCGHDDYHAPHEWADRPAVWCPGHSHATGGAS
ncbi:hypothetical protein AB852_28245 [Streptomyces uncialis]|uniref:Uncharacterized protein n=1 Tax=Streptomyces uncialis TaxID=1048205 RepID=A0A1Q4V0U5_9ACTN|nr:hypothetical protein AB852_28245 [Streptomyces uncialis]